MKALEDIFRCPKCGAFMNFDLYGMGRCPNCHFSEEEHGGYPRCPTFIKIKDDANLEEVRQ